MLARLFNNSVFTSCSGQRRCRLAGGYVGLRCMGSRLGHRFPLLGRLLLGFLRRLALVGWFGHLLSLRVRHIGTKAGLQQGFLSHQVLQVELIFYNRRNYRTGHIDRAIRKGIGGLQLFVSNITPTNTYTSLSLPELATSRTGSTLFCMVLVISSTKLQGSVGSFCLASLKSEPFRLAFSIISVNLLLNEALRGCLTVAVSGASDSEDSLCR